MNGEHTYRVSPSNASHPKQFPATSGGRRLHHIARSSQCRTTVLNAPKACRTSVCPFFSPIDIPIAATGSHGVAGGPEDPVPPLQNNRRAPGFVGSCVDCKPVAVIGGLHEVQGQVAPAPPAEVAGAIALPQRAVDVDARVGIPGMTRKQQAPLTILM